MVAWQNDHAGGGFGDRAVEVGGGFPHHHATDGKHRIIDGGSAGGGNALAQRNAERDIKGRRFTHRPGDGDDLADHRPALGGGGNIGQRFHILHHGSDMNRQSRRRNQAPGHRVHQIVFVTRGIVII